MAQNEVIALRERVSALSVQCNMLDIAIIRARESEKQAKDRYDAICRRIDEAYLTATTNAEMYKRQGETEKQQFYESVAKYLFNVFWEKVTR